MSCRSATHSPAGAHAARRRALPGVAAVQVVHVRDASAVEEATAVAPHVDAVLDSGNPTLELKELGGTGWVHDWEISRQVCEEVLVPVSHAGGLRPDNVEMAVRVVAAVDVCSGVRTDGRLDEAKLVRFMAALGSRREIVVGFRVAFVLL